MFVCDHNGNCPCAVRQIGDKIDLTKFMQVSGVLCVLSYLFVGLSAMPILGLIGCIICGFSVGIMWPGSISITVPRIPKGGTALFALLAVAGRSWVVPWVRVWWDIFRSRQEIIFRQVY